MVKLTAFILTLVTANAVYVAATPVRYAEWDDSWAQNAPQETADKPTKRWRSYYRPHIAAAGALTPGGTSTTSRSTSPTESVRTSPSPAAETESSSSHSTQTFLPTAVPHHSLHPLGSSTSTQSQELATTVNLAATSTQVSQPTTTESSQSHHWPAPYNRPWGYIPPARQWYPRPPWYSRRRDEISGYEEEDYDEHWSGEEGY